MKIKRFSLRAVTAVASRNKNYLNNSCFLEVIIFGLTLAAKYIRSRSQMFEFCHISRQCFQKLAGGMKNEKHVNFGAFLVL